MPVAGLFYSRHHPVRTDSDQVIDILDFDAGLTQTSFGVGLESN